MKHPEASQLLSERDTGRLAPDQVRALDAHLAGCEECTAWLATYRRLATSLVETPSQEHLDSQELCAFALGSAELSPAARSRCESHLEECTECSHEVGLVRSATEEPAEQTVSLGNVVEGPWRPRAMPSAVALAATLVLLIGGLVIVDRLSMRVPHDYRLVGQSVQSDRTIEAKQSIEVAATEVESGSMLNLEGEVIAFGEGFSVARGAALAVSTNPPSGEDDSSQS